MKTKIVYVLVSEETDYYYEMVLLSLYSLRLYHPNGDTEVELVMDEASYQRLVDKRAAILDDVTPIVVPIPPEYTKMQRSRYLKTQLRQLVKGAFLYIDNDTIICNRLDEIDEESADVAMVADVNSDLLLIANQHSIDRCNAAGFPDVIGKPYFNSGVAFVKDTDAAYNFFIKWHVNWQKSMMQGVNYDQPALCQSNIESDYIVKELSGVWNCQIFCNGAINYLKGKKIIHYYTLFNSCSKKILFDQIRTKGYVDDYFCALTCNPSYDLCISVFTANERLVYGYLFSEMFSVYVNTPSLFKLYISMSRFLRKPVVILWKLKKTLFSKYK